MDGLNRAMTTSGNAQGYGQPPKAVTAATLIGETTDEIQSASIRLARAVNAVREFNDGIHGSQPSTGIGQTSGEVPELPTRAQGLRNEVRLLQEALTALESEVERLNRV